MPPPTRRKRDVVTKKTTIAPPSSHPPADAAKKGSGGGGASAGAAAPASTSPSLFYPFRALGYITESAPFAVQRRGTEAFVTVSAGRAWQIYNCDKLRLVMVGPQFPADITALAARGDLTFAGVGRDIVVCRRSHRVCTFEGHAAAITLLIAFGSKLISVCAGGRVMAWDISRDAIDHLDGHRSGKGLFFYILCFLMGYEYEFFFPSSFFCM